MFGMSYAPPPGLQRLSRFQFAEVMARWAAEVGPMVEAELKRAAPVGKGPGAGRLRDSIRHRAGLGPAGMTISFSSTAPHARFVIRGTRPHEIRPTRGRALYWTDGGGGHFARLVHHPGTKPNPFARRAVRPLLPVVEQRLAHAVQKALGG